MNDYQTLNANGFDYLLFPAEGTPKSLIVVFHGNGADAANMKGWIGSLRPENKDADIISVEGPVLLNVPANIREKYKIPADLQLRSWFDMDNLWSLVKHLAAHIFNRVALFRNLNTFIDAQLAERGLQDDRLIIAGLSLGGIVAGHTALARPVPCAGLVLSSAAVLPGLRVRARPETFVSIGSADHVFYGVKMPKKFLSRQFARAYARVGLTHDLTVNRLKKRGISVDARVYEGMPHIPSDEAERDGARFMAKQLG